MPADPLNPVSANREELARIKANEMYEQRGREQDREVDPEQQRTLMRRHRLHL